MIHDELMGAADFTQLMDDWSMGRKVREMGGFTRDDVERLQVMVNVYDDDADNFEVTGLAALWLGDLADRIEALLPPEDADV